MIDKALRQFDRATAADMTALRAAFHSEDFDALETSAHRLKGAAMVVGAGAVAAHSVTVERAPRGGDLKTAQASLPALIAAVADVTRLLSTK